MGEIQQALFECKFKIMPAPPPESELDEFMALSNPHPEDHPRTGTPVTVVDFHGQKFSFGMPIDLLDKLRATSLLSRQGQYLNITGTDVNGRSRSYSFPISSQFVSNLAYYIFTVLSVAYGSDFAQPNMGAWTDWMKKGDKMPFDYAPLYASYPATIKKMPRKQPTQPWDFSSHEFILEWTHDNQEAYIEALHAQKDERPFAIVHGKLAQGLNQYPKLVQQAGDIDSVDIFGHKNRCMSWRRILSTD